MYNLQFRLGNSLSFYLITEDDDDGYNYGGSEETSKIKVTQVQFYASNYKNRSYGGGIEKVNIVSGGEHNFIFVIKK